MKFFSPALLLVIFLTILNSQSSAQSKSNPAPLVLWYDTPATEWMTQALPIGNGHVGVMFFGGVEEERLQFSEGSLWSGGKNANAAYDFGLKKEQASICRKYANCSLLVS